jgi:hypothetical protein
MQANNILQLITSNFSALLLSPINLFSRKMSEENLNPDEPASKSQRISKRIIMFSDDEETPRKRLTLKPPTHVGSGD